MTYDLYICLCASSIKFLLHFLLSFRIPSIDSLLYSQHSSFSEDAALSDVQNFFKSNIQQTISTFCHPGHFEFGNQQFMSPILYYLLLYVPRRKNVRFDYNNLLTIIKQIEVGMSISKRHEYHFMLC